MLVFEQEFLNTARHPNVQSPCIVIPFQFYTTIKVACPVLGEFIFLLDTPNEMIGVFFTNAFYPKIVHNQRERD